MALEVIPGLDESFSKSKVNVRCPKVWDHRKEVPVLWRLEPEAIMVEGVIDLVYQHQNVWHVVDYKTDEDPDSEGIAAYSRQVTIYVRALGEALGGDCQGHILFV
jgi:ATP-dependent exoDNAse (exonuclease V) beta subunit